MRKERCVVHIDCTDVIGQGGRRKRARMGRIPVIK